MRTNIRRSVWTQRHLLIALVSLLSLVVMVHLTAFSASAEDPAGRQIFSAARDTQGSSPTTPATRVGLSEAYGKLPLYFEANRGQTDSQVKFLSRGRGYVLFLTSAEAVLVLGSAQRTEQGNLATL